MSRKFVVFWQSSWFSEQTIKVRQVGGKKTATTITTYECEGVLLETQDTHNQLENYAGE